MKILMQSRIDLFTRRGGDTVQIEQTAEELRRLGVEVAVDCSATPDLKSYDLVHLFNLDWPAQVYLQAKNAKRQGKPIIFSPIHHSFAEIERYEKEARYDSRRLINAVLATRESRERFKDLCRMVADSKKIPSTLVEFRQGIRNEQQELLRLADLVLVQTAAEAKDIERDFGFVGEEFEGQTLFRGEDKGNRFCWVKVVNGVALHFAGARPEPFIEKYHLSDFVLCVGRIEPRKNQLSLIKALTKVRDKLPEAQLVFVGQISKRHPEYAWRFARARQKYSWIHHIPAIPYAEMGSCYAACRVHVLPSWFETTGLVNLEAALAGARVVATRGRSEEYLGEGARYCDPGDIDLIVAAILEIWDTEPRAELRQRILENFTWNKVAEQTREAYRLLQS